MDNQSTISKMNQSDISVVAEQFVLCYYNLMHASPDQLHRFYQDSSTMIYEDSAVFGQQKIHEKFMDVNLRNNSGVQVHVLQLDALKAQDKIVIQVAGEMRANECEWRRFMQTFVLSEVSPNNFFVLNDIFRFQDRVFAEAATNNFLSDAKLPTNVVDDSKKKPTSPTTQMINLRQNGVAEHEISSKKPLNNSPGKRPQETPVQHIDSSVTQTPVELSNTSQSEESNETIPKSWAQMASNPGAKLSKALLEQASSIPQHTDEINNNEKIAVNNEPVHVQQSRGFERGRGPRGPRTNAGYNDRSEMHNDLKSRSNGSRGGRTGGRGSGGAHRGNGIAVGGPLKRN